MPKFALFRDGVFAEVRILPSRPDDISHKLIAWYPVGTISEGTPAGWSIVGGEAVQTIAPPPAPSTDPNDYPLQPFQFEAMLEILGKVAAVDTAIGALTDATVRAVARAKRRSPPGGVFHRNDPLFATLAPTVGLTDAQIDTAWMQAKDIV